MTTLNDRLQALIPPATETYWNQHTTPDNSLAWLEFASYVGHYAIFVDQTSPPAPGQEMGYSVFYHPEVRVAEAITGTVPMQAGMAVKFGIAPTIAECIQKSRVHAAQTLTAWASRAAS